VNDTALFWHAGFGDIVNAGLMAFTLIVSVPRLKLVQPLVSVSMSLGT
jgi:hypothetical protein